MLADAPPAAESPSTQASCVYELVVTGGDGQLVASVPQAQVAFSLYCLQKQASRFRTQNYYLNSCNAISRGAA